MANEQHIINKLNRYLMDINVNISTSNESDCIFTNKDEIPYYLNIRNPSKQTQTYSIFNSILNLVDDTDVYKGFLYWLKDIAIWQNTALEEVTSSSNTLNALYDRLCAIKAYSLEELEIKLDLITEA